MKSKLFQKLRSRIGESIAETLVALLIASLALIMLASMIRSTVSMVTRSEETMTAYYAANDALETGSAAGINALLTLRSTETGVTWERSVIAGENTQISRTPVVSYRLSGSSGSTDSGD